MAQTGNLLDCEVEWENTEDEIVSEYLGHRRRRCAENFMAHCESAGKFWGKLKEENEYEKFGQSENIVNPKS